MRASFSLPRTGDFSLPRIDLPLPSPLPRTDPSPPPPRHLPLQNTCLRDRGDPRDGPGAGDASGLGLAAAPDDRVVLGAGTAAPRKSDFVLSVHTCVVVLAAVDDDGDCGDCGDDDGVVDDGVRPSSLSLCRRDHSGTRKSTACSARPSGQSSTTTSSGTGGARRPPPPSLMVPAQNGHSDGRRVADRLRGGSCAAVRATVYAAVTRPRPCRRQGHLVHQPGLGGLRRLPWLLRPVHPAGDMTW